MAEIVSIKVKVEDHGKAMSQVIALKNNIDYINSHHINVKVDNANQLEQITRKMTAYNNSVARRVTAETRLATAIEYRKAEESKAQAALARRGTAEERTKQAIERTRQAEERTRQAIERTAQTQERTTQITERARLAQERANTATRQGADANTILGTSLTGLVTRFVSLHMLLSRTVSAFRDALKTMKEVDSALVTIQKTTGFTGQQLDQLTNSAYELANAYGRTATEILNAASVYARAGFKDNLNQMTELSALLQNVGDLEGEVAAKFLIATNAAWKLNGSYDALMGVIDGLNAQTNQAAVDMEALTSGITVAGSVFSNAGESVQTFAGLLGAGVALTQRSGSEVARGLRTIAMNIRQIKGELDDGEIIDEASISDAAKALHSVGISVADANGELRLTSKVLDELAERWGSLTTAEQSYLAQSLAGKRQANILNALMNNWEEAQRQMTLYANGAGSALQENEIYLNSWEAKTKQLSAAWTKFVNDLVDTDLIKGALDAIIKLVGLLDTGVGRLLITTAGIATAVVAITGAISGLKTAVTLLTAAMSANPLFLAVAGATGAVLGIKMIADAIGNMKTNTEKLADLAKKTQDEYESINKEVKSLKGNEEKLTELEREKLRLLEEQAAIKKKEADEAAKAAALASYQEKYRGSLEASGYLGTYMAYQRRKETASRDEFFAIEDTMHGIESRAESEGATQRVKSLISEYSKLASALKAAKTPEEFERIEESADEVYKAIVAMAVELSGMAEILGDDMPSNGKLALSMLTAFIAQVKVAKGEIEATANESGAAVDALRNRLQKMSDEADSMDTVIAAVTDALEKYGEKSLQVYDAMRNLESVIPGSTDKLYDFETATLKSGDALDGTKSNLLDLIDAEKQVNFQNAIDQMNAVAQAAWDMWAAEAMAIQGLSQDDLLRAGEWMNNSSVDALIAERERWNSYVATLRGRSDYSSSSGGGGGSSSSSSDPELARLQNILKLHKQEVEFLKASGKSQGEINAKQKEVQAALHDLAEYMRSIEADEADILSLSTEWWTIQNSMAEVEEDQLKVYQDRVSLLKSELSLLEAQGASTDEIVAKQRQIQDALKAQENYMRSIGASQTEINALATEWYEIENKILKTQQDLFDQLKRTIDEYYDAAVNDKKKELEYEEKILAVQKAQIALQNAQNERNVRYFNAASGQWEWGANAKNVQSAKEALSKAQDALVDNQEQAAWAEFKSAWEYIAEKIKSGETTFDRAYKYMYNKMVEIQNKYNVDMGDVLEDSVGSFEGVNKTITELDEQTAKQLGASVKSLKDANTNLGTAVGTLDTTLTDATANAKYAVDAFKSAFDTAKKRVENGEWDIDTAFQYLRKKAKEISKTYGIDMTDALNKAISQMKTVYTGLKGISDAVKKGALTPKEAFDIISKALNSVSEKYGKSITSSVNDILKKKGGFEDGLDGLAKAVANGDMTFEDAWKLLEGAIDDTTKLYGIDLQGELDTAIQNMGKSANALDDLWKTIVLNKMRMNSVSWLELDAQEKKAKEAGDTALVQKIQDQKAALHAENEALGATIGATYDKSGYWSLNGQKLYDPQADLESGEFSGGGGAVAGSRATDKNQDTIDAFGKHANSGQEQYFIPGMGVMNIGSATADLFNMKAGMKGNSITRYNVLFSGLFTPEEQAAYLSSGGIVTEEMAAKWNSQPTSYLYDFPLAMQDSSVQQMMANSGFNANGEYEGVAKVYGGAAGNTLVQIKNGKLVTSGLEGTGSNMLVTADGKILRFDKNGHVYATGETWESSRGSYDSTQKRVVAQLVFDEQNKMLESGDYSFHDIYGRDGVYDEGGVLHGIGGIKATARDEMVLPPDITERLLTPINNGFVRGRMDDLRSMLGMQTEFGSVDNTRIGTQNNGDIYTMNGVTISEGQARVTTVYDLAQMARNLGAYKRS